MKNISKTYTKLRSAHAYLLGVVALMLGISLSIPNPPLNTARDRKFVGLDKQEEQRKQGGRRRENRDYSSSIDPSLKLSFSLGDLSPGLWSQPRFRITSLFSLSASALDLGDGRTFFERSPRLIRSAPSFRGPTAPANYYFTIEVPEDAGEPLKAVTILQQTNLEQIVFFPSQTRAFFGDSFEEDSSIPLASVNRESSEKNGVKVVFEKSVEPGNVVTISLRARNPRYGGIYQFGVTAFPVGENSQGLYLGAGRIHFSQGGGRN